MNTDYLPTIFLAFCLSLLPLCATAETDTPRTGQQATQQINTPEKGLNMSQVESEFGTPLQKLTPVGTPPITRWKYKDFTVYFEHQFVIHTVVHH